jgi:translation initiation factor IF-3
VGPAGEQVGVVKIEVALRLAQEADLDLVEVAPNSKPPVVKIMDYGKFKYEAAQKAKEARRNQANTILKEVRFRLKIDKHDYETKRKRAEGFLQAGDKVKAMILFRGREQSRPEQGVRLLQRFAEDVAEYGTVESSPMIDGRNMVMIIGPLRNKADAKAEQMAQRAASKAARKVADAAPQGDAPASKPAAVKPAVEKPAVEKPAAAKPAVEKPSAAKLAIAKPVAETPAAEAPEAKPAVAKPAAAKAPAAKAPAAKPAAEKPAAEKPAAAKPAAEKAEKPAAAKPAAAKPAAAPKPSASA